MNEEIKKYLKENLQIVIEKECDWEDSTTIDVKLVLENEIISSSFIWIRNQA